jgi:hypothetical protein
MDDSIDVQNLSFEEKIRALEEYLPEPILNFLHSPERDAVSLRLSQKYNLHADQAGSFERAYLYMLLGVNTPEDFVQDLKDGGIDQDTIRGLTTDINELVFKRLQQEELAVPATPAQAYRSAPPRAEVPVMQVAPPPPASPAPAPVPNTPPVMAPTPAEPAPTPSFNLIRPDAIVSTPQPVFRTMQSDMEALQHPAPQPAEGGWSSMPTIPHPSQVSPARSFQTASVPYTSMPVASVPLPAEPAPFTAPTSSSVSLPPLTELKPQVPRVPVSGKYDSDPYRETF